MIKKLQNTIIGLCFLLALIILAFSFKTPVKAKDEPKKTEQTVPAKKKTGKTDPEKKPEVLPTPADEALALVVPEEYRSVEGITPEAGTFISVLMRDGSGGFADQFREGIKDACDQINKQAGYKGKDKARINCNAPTKADDISGQSSILDEELGLYPDVVAASIVDEKACEVQFDLAMENGIQIVGFDAAPAYREVAATVGTDNAKASVESVAHLKEAMNAAGGSGPVLIFSSDITSTNMKSRELTAKKTCGQQGIRVANVYHRSDIARAKKVVSKVLAADADPKNDIPVERVTESDIIRFIFSVHPEAKGVWLGDERTAKAVLTVMLEDGIDMQAVGFASPEGLDDYMEQGVLYGAIEENPYGMGYATAAVAFRIAAGQDVAKKIETGYRWHPAEETE